MDTIVSLLFLTLLCLLYAAFRAQKKASLADVPGPRPESFWLGMSSARFPRVWVGFSRR